MVRMNSPPELVKEKKAYVSFIDCHSPMLRSQGHGVLTEGERALILGVWVECMDASIN